MSAAHASGAQSPGPGEVYGRVVFLLSITSVLLSGLLLIGSSAIVFDPLWRSVSAGVGLVGLSTGLTVFVSALMYRLAPPATAPALAVLYLLKVTVLGWILLFVGAPQWLQPRGFAITVAVSLVLSWLVLSPVAVRASRVLAGDYQRRVLAERAESPRRAETDTPASLGGSKPTFAEGGERDGT